VVSIGLASDREGPPVGLLLTGVRPYIECEAVAYLPVKTLPGFQGEFEGDRKLLNYGWLLTLTFPLRVSASPRDNGVL